MLNTLVKKQLSKINSVILSRANNLYRRESVKKNQHTPGTIIFDVHGDSGFTYKVTVKYDDDSVYTDCNCPYGKNCKHTAAALIFIKENNVQSLLVIPSIQRVAIETLKVVHDEIVIPNPEKISYSELLNIKQYNSMDFFISTLTPMTYLVIEDNLLKIRVYTHIKEGNMLFEIYPEKMRCTCSCTKTSTSKNKTICEHLKYVFYHFKTNGNFKFLDDIATGQISNAKRNTLEKLGIDDISLFEKYFELKIKDCKIKIEERQKNSLTIHPETEDYINKRVTDMMATNNLPEVTSKLNNKSDETRAVGVAISVHNDKNLLALDIFDGKLTKSKDNNLVSSQIWAGYSYLSNIFSDNILRQIYVYSNQLNEMAKLYNQNKYQKFAILVLKQIKPLLENIEYLYVADQDSFEYKKVTTRNATRIKLSDITPSLYFEFTEDEYFYILKSYLKIGDELIENYSINFFTYFWLVNGIIYFCDSIKIIDAVHFFKNANPIQYPKKTFSNYNLDFINTLSENFEINFQTTSLIINKEQSDKFEKQIYISEKDDFVIFSLVVKYKDDFFIDILKPGNVIKKQGEAFCIIERDKDNEQLFIDDFKLLHKDFSEQESDEYLYLPYDKFLKKMWFYKAFEHFKNNNIELFGINKLTKFKYSPHKANCSISIASNEDWFDISVKISFGDTEVSLKDVQKAVFNNQNFIQLKDGTQGIIPEEWFNKFEKYFRHAELKKEGLKLSKMKFTILDELFEGIDNQEILMELAEKRRKLLSFEKIHENNIPPEINATLRDYQVAGYNWLNFLNDFKWGGILADDMGLGKTLQVITFLENQIKINKKTNLVVVPTTLIFNWRNEIEKFTHNWNVFYHHGNVRLLNKDEIKKYRLIITTYGLIINDIEMFSEYKFNYVILDESQAIKNPNSKRYKAVCLLKATNRIVMTGTPIENNTFDLYSQMNFLNPGFLGSQNNFKEDFSNAIDKEGDQDIALELKKLISPFVLRRTKEQVAKELPDKLEDYVYCIMEDEQRKVYEAFKSKYKNYLLDKFETEGYEKSQLYILEGILKLRQICDSPELLNEKEFYGTESIKIKELIRNIQDKTAYHKILIFSQFVSMLQIIKRELLAHKITFEYLDGQCSQIERENSVKNFQTDNNCRVFLISLKAGGMGLNLTAADYVFIVDPWWNPAVENQAIDRCYRIGQDKKVFAYRMICKDTLEEKIVNLQKKKLAIATDIIQIEENFVKSLKREDILNLFD